MLFASWIQLGGAPNNILGYKTRLGRNFPFMGVLEQPESACLKSSTLCICGLGEPRAPREDPLTLRVGRGGCLDWALDEGKEVKEGWKWFFFVEGVIS
jgi:hypothetical protein